MKHVASLLIVFSLGYFLFAAHAEVPPFGAADTAIHNQVKQRYVDQGVEETGSVNTVAAIITDYRSFDTLGEVTVLFIAMVAAAAVLEKSRPTGGSAS